MYRHTCLLVGVLLSVAILQPCARAAFVEDFEPNPLDDTTHYLPDL
jgi:hypothetical protein